MTNSQKLTYQQVMKKAILCMNNFGGFLTNASLAKFIVSDLKKLSGELKSPEDAKYLNKVEAMSELITSYIKDVEKARTTAGFYARKSEGIGSSL